MAATASRRRSVETEGSPGLKPAPVDRRARILEAATRRFAEFGYEAATVRQIGDDVSLLSGSLYHHFATKDDMLHEIVQGPVQQMRDNILRIAEANVDAERRLTALILLDLGELTRNQAVHAILFNERKFFRRRPEFAYVVQAKKAAYLGWRKVLDEGVAAGLFRPGLDLYLTIATIVRMLNTAADWFRNEDPPGPADSGADDLERYIDFHLDFILGAVRHPARTAEPIPRAECEDLARFVV